MSADWRDQVLDGARLQPGDDVLDLGAGTGLLTFGAHDRIGDGWVFAVDPSVDVLEELLRDAHEADLPGVMYLIGDPKVLPLPDGSVDAAVTRAGLMDVEDLPGCAQELHRVLRPGGRLSLLEPIDVNELAAALGAAGFVDVDYEVLDAQAWITARRI